MKKSPKIKEPYRSFFMALEILPYTSGNLKEVLPGSFPESRNLFLRSSIKKLKEMGYVNEYNVTLEGILFNKKTYQWRDLIKLFREYENLHDKTYRNLFNLASFSIGEYSLDYIYHRKYFEIAGLFFIGKAEYDPEKRKIIVRW